MSNKTYRHDSEGTPGARGAPKQLTIVLPEETFDFFVEMGRTNTDPSGHPEPLSVMQFVQGYLIALSIADHRRSDPSITHRLRNRTLKR